MYCSKCGTENESTATTCSLCGNQISAQPVAIQGSVGELAKKDQELKKSSVILIIILTTITAGIYIPVWFIKRRKPINSLQSSEKLGYRVFIFVIAIIGISLLLDFMAGSSEAMGEMRTASGINLISSILTLVAATIILVQSFKVRRIFYDHFNVHLKRDISISDVATFFLTIYYLQFKINRF